MPCRRTRDDRGIIPTVGATPDDCAIERALFSASPDLVRQRRRLGPRPSRAKSEPRIDTCACEHAE